MLKMRIMRLVIIAVLASGISTSVRAQSKSVTEEPASEPPVADQTMALVSTAYTENDLEKQVPAARPEDVSSPEAIVRAMHDSVSGPKGSWNPDRLRSLCLPNSLWTYGAKEDDGIVHYNVVTVDGLVKVLTAIHRDSAWYEAVNVTSIDRIDRQTDSFSMATVRATGYEGTTPRILPKEQKPPTAMTDVVYIGKRWWIISHTW